jgi:hypothetical protein
MSLFNESVSNVADTKRKVHTDSNNLGGGCAGVYETRLRRNAAFPYGLQLKL